MRARFGVTSLLPIGLVVLHAFERDQIQARGALLQDLAATALALGVCLVFVARSLLRPIRELESAMVRVQSNDLDVTLPVLGNDETGRLADGFNRMVRGLRERALIRETFGSYLLVDERTVEILREPHALAFLDEVEIRGRDQKVRVYGQAEPDVVDATAHSLAV